MDGKRQADANELAGIRWYILSLEVSALERYMGNKLYLKSIEQILAHALANIRLLGQHNQAEAVADCEWEICQDGKCQRGCDHDYLAGSKVYDKRPEKQLPGQVPGVRVPGVPAGGMGVPPGPPLT